MPSASAVSDAQERSYEPTYWLEGAAIGATIVGTTGGWIAYELGCNFSDVRSDCAAGPILGLALVGGLTGGVVGGLIGGGFSAPQERPLRGQPVKGATIGAIGGALWSFGLFWQFCLNGCRAEEIRFGLGTTAVGALAGWLVSR